MGWIKQLEDWLQKRKLENKTGRDVFEKGGRIGIIKVKCPNCPSKKMFYKNGIYKCCKCKKFVKL